MRNLKACGLALLAFLATMLSMDAGINLVQAGEVAQSAASTPDDNATPRTNDEIRRWYNDQVAVIPALNEQWRKDGLSVETRACKAYDIRHGARLKAREFMPDKREVADLQARDQEKYGNPDGPTFEYLVQKNRDEGLTGDEVYENIIGSAKRTNEGYNKRFGVTPTGMSP
ncbi:MAG: hypothetical protein WC091_10865 [Sulfuricellaceae bacterium]